MRRYWIFGASAVLLASALGAATLERLSLDDMTAKSTAIVRGRVVGSFGQIHGAVIYTHYRIEVSEQWKGAPASFMEVVVPGGVAGGLRQTFSGAPKPETGREYVLFLWRSRTGLTHIIGLSQGLLTLNKDAAGNVMASRGASSEVMLDSSGQVVRDSGFTMQLNDLRTRVRSGAAGGQR